MHIDVHQEKVLSLNEAAKELPSIDGKKPHLSTLWRWCRIGVRGVRLDYGRLGNRIVTSKEALTRFVNALAAADSQYISPPLHSLKAKKPTDRRRAMEIVRAKRSLENI